MTIRHRVGVVTAGLTMIAAVLALGAVPPTPGAAEDVAAVPAVEVPSRQVVVPQRSLDAPVQQETAPTQPVESDEVIDVGPAVAEPVRLEFAAAAPVNRLVLAGPADPSRAMTSGIVQFSDGSRLLVTPDAAGNAELTFPARDVDGATLHPLGFASAQGSIGDTAFTLGYQQTTAVADVAPTPYASSNGSDVGGLVDGDPSTADAGNEWAPNPSDAHPTVALEWPTPAEIAAVQILGPSAVAFDPASSAAASLWGELLFDDGSRVVVSGIEGGDAQPTTVAFVPRMTTSVRLVLHSTIPQATPGVREFRAYERGTTPPRWRTGTGGYAASPAAEECGASSPSAGTASSAELALVCPSAGAAVSGSARVVVAGQAGRVVDAWSVDPFSARPSLLSSATIGRDGRAVLDIDLAALPAGPLALRATYRDVPEAKALPVQLFNTGGAPTVAHGHAPSGMTLQWSEEFLEPLSVTQLGENSTYAATKPAYWGESEFGSAIFADPALGRDTIVTVDGFLRIRVEARGSLADPKGWGREHVSGILSSAKVGGTGFFAQYGYFEARMLAPAGDGTWPAFWLLNSENTTSRGGSTAGEIDVVELYGHNSGGSCHAVHSWADGRDDGTVACEHVNGFTDWSLAWHTYAAQVYPDRVDYFIDGVLVESLPAPHHSDEPLFFMVNLALGGGWPVDLAARGDAADLYVDWIRVHT